MVAVNRPLVLHVSSARLAFGGVERFLLNLCEGLQEEFQFVLLSDADAVFQPRARQAGCYLSNWRVRGPMDLRAARLAAAALSLHQPAIVHLHDARAAFIVRLFARHKKTKVIYTVHLPPYYYRWNRFTALRRWMYVQVERLLNLFLTDAIIYPSVSSWKESLYKRYVPPHKAFCIPNGIDLTSFAVPAATPRPKNEAPVICTVGRLGEEKNVGLLLEAASILAKQGYKFSLWIVGDGPQRITLETMADRLGIAPYVHFWGAQADVSFFLHRADIFVLASWYEGGRTYAVMEAQAAGLPCILSDIADHADMVANGCGKVFPPGDALSCARHLEELLLDPQVRLEMGQAGRARAFQEYAVQAMIEKYRHLYQNLIEGCA